MKIRSIVPKYMEYFPDELAPGVLYISLEHKTAAHLCCCGCGEEVVTPLSPIGWKLRGSKEIVSLRPSIANLNLKCKSHYWIRKNVVVRSYDISEEEAARIQRAEQLEKLDYVNSLNTSSSGDSFVKRLRRKIAAILHW